MKNFPYVHVLLSDTLVSFRDKPRKPHMATPYCKYQNEISERESSLIWSEFT